MMKRISVKRHELISGNVYWDETFTFKRDDGELAYGDFCIFIDFETIEGEEFADVRRCTTQKIGNLTPSNTERHLVRLNKLFEL